MIDVAAVRAMPTVVVRRERLHFLPLDDGSGLLLDEPRRRVVGMNATSALLWGLAWDEREPAGLARALAERTGIDRRTAKSLVDEAVAGWDDLGLLAGASTDPPPASPTDDASPSAGAIGFAAERHYALGDHRILIRFSSAAAAELVAAPLAHLSAAAGPAESVVEVLHKSSGFLVRRGGDLSYACERPEDVVVWVLAAMVRARLLAGGFVLAVHAGVIGDREGCVLLPAVSGSGKSTLCAALIRRGHAYLSDEIALLRAGTFEVQSMPLPLSIKREGRSVLAPLYPELADLPLRTNEFGRVLCFLSPPPGSLDHTRVDRRVRAIAFPRYVAGARTEVRSLSTHEVVTRLLAQCGGLPPSFRLADLRGMVAWIGGLRCRELTFGSLDEAVRSIEELAGWAEPRP